MNKLLLLVLFLHPWVARGESRSLDDLLYDATRYANTPERREAKAIAREALLARMPDALRAAMRWVHGDRVMVQVLAMEWVMTLPEDVVVPVLLEFLDAEREDTRRVALFFLGFKDAPEHAAQVMPHLANEHTRGAALRTLGKWRVAEVRPVAEQWLTEGGERVRVVAANALRDIGDPAAVPALVRALEDPVFTVRNTAARAILVLTKDDRSLIPESAGAGRMLERIRMDAGLSEMDEGVAAEDYF